MLLPCQIESLPSDLLASRESSVARTPAYSLKATRRLWADEFPTGGRSIPPMIAPVPDAVAFCIRGPIARSDLPGLCERVCTWLTARAADIIVCDVVGVDPDAVAVDALARLHVAAGRYGCKVRLRHASDELLELVAFMGLLDVLPERAMTDESAERRRSQERNKRILGGSMPSNLSRKLFVNLAVGNLERSVEFFTELGFTFNPRFTDEHATCMIVSDEAFVMLLTGPRFKDFTKKELCDSTTSTEAILALSAESREEADALADRALVVGGAPANDPIDMGFMYGRSFQDPDGHLWEVFWIDPDALVQ